MAVPIKAPTKAVLAYWWVAEKLFVKAQVVGMAAKDCIYIREGWEDNAELIRHETVHVNQINRDGRLKFYTKYAYYSLRYGYRNNPYEVEAYANS